MWARASDALANSRIEIGAPCVQADTMVRALGLLASLVRTLGLLPILAFAAQRAELHVPWDGAVTIEPRALVVARRPMSPSHNALIS